MSTAIELNSEIAQKILIDASEKGLSVEVYLKEIIETEDERLNVMREAMGDELFLADLKEVAEDFHHIDLD